MTRTTNLKLPQFAAGDPIQRLDFNDAFSKIDKNCGNARITWGSYTGTGNYGANNPNTLSFSFKPQVIFLFSTVEPTAYNSIPVYFILMRPLSRMNLALNHDGVVTWGDKSVTWYNDEDYQLNRRGVTYYYIALG